jgi:hypothetical protein
MRFFLLCIVLLTVSFASAQTNVIQEPKPKYTADSLTEENKLPKKEKAKLKKWRAPRKVEAQDPKTEKPEKSIEEQIKDEDRSDLSPSE